MNEWSTVKVLILTLNGKYLVRKGDAWTLTRDWSEATLFDYPDPAFMDYLKGVPNAYLPLLVAAPTTALEAYEICDRCGQMIRPAKAFFDGTQFVCRDCRALALGDPPAVPTALNDDSCCLAPS